MSVDLSQLDEIRARYEKLSYMLSEPDVLADQTKIKLLLREQKSLSPLVDAYTEYRKTETDLKNLSRDIALLRVENDAELLAVAKEESAQAEAKKAMILDRISELLLPKDPDDDKSVVVEIRAGTGGEEAALFAADIFRAYSMYASSAGLKISVTDENETELGGYKMISFLLEGDGAYGRFKFESGTHRVQRVPVTDSQGKLQTSAITVAVLPEAEDVDVTIAPGDIEIDTCKSSGAGGQHINKTESAVRVTHKPSGIVVECRSERSQLQNKDHAMKILRAKLYEIAQNEQYQKIADARKSQVGSGDRSAKIRTYNYPQNRITDHRISFSLYDLDNYMNGAFQPMIDAMTAADAEQKRKQNETLV